MGIRVKTLLAIVAAVVCLAALLLAISATVMLKGYRQLEEREMAAKLGQVNAAIEEELAGMKATARDWANWDDTYAFISNAGQSYVESNLNPDILANLGLAYMLFFDTSGSLVYGAGLGADAQEMAEVPPEVADTSSKTGFLLARGDGDPGVEGILRFPQGNMLAASRPILTSSGQGPFRGTLVMMRPLDEAEVERLSRLTLLSIAMRPVEKPEPPDDFRRAAAQLNGESSICVHPMSGDRVAGYTLLRDISGEPALILRVEADRFVYKQGLASVYSFAWMLLAVILICGGLMLFLLDRLVISRLARLDANIAKITASGDPAMRVSARGRDEISRLAGAINGMLDELERSQGDLRDSEERYRGLVERAPDAMYTVSLPEGVITSLNPAFEAWTGWPEATWTGRTFFPLIHPDDLETARRNFRETAEGKASPPYELRILTDRGDYVTGEVISAPIVRRGKVEGEFGIVRDVTRRRLTQERLVKLNRCFVGLGAEPGKNIQRIVEAGLDILTGALMEYRRHSEEGYRVRAWRQGHELPWGGDLDGAHPSCEAIIEKEEKRLVAKEPAGAGGSGTGCDGGHIDGRPLPASLDYPVMLEGKAVGNLRWSFGTVRECEQEEIEIMGVLARAISIEEERRLREEELRDFVDVASHELRHPVTVIKGYALILKNKKEQLGEEAREELLGLIDQGADRLNKLVGDLLDISRIERGKFRVKREELPLEPLIARAGSEMEARGFDNRFSSRVRGDLDGCSVDGERLVQLLVILMENAAKYSPPGSPVEVEVGVAEEGVVVSVLDRGAGVPVHEAERIFDRFYQVEEVAHHSTSGMGMGLYIARSIVEAHGGRIWYEPRPGGGSIFRFTIRREGNGG